MFIIIGNDVSIEAEYSTAFGKKSLAVALAQALLGTN